MLLNNKAYDTHTNSKKFPEICITRSFFTIFIFPVLSQINFTSSYCIFKINFSMMYAEVFQVVISLGYPHQNSLWICTPPHYASHVLLYCTTLIIFG
jgi:hypothetical protein